MALTSKAWVPRRTPNTRGECLFLFLCARDDLFDSAAQRFRFCACRLAVGRHHGLGGRQPFSFKPSDRVPLRRVLIEQRAEVFSLGSSYLSDVSESWFSA